MSCDIKDMLNDEVFMNALYVASAMGTLGKVASIEEYREVVAEYEKRVRIWRGSVLARLVREGCDISNE